MDFSTTTNQAGTYVEKDIEVQAQIQAHLPPRQVRMQRKTYRYKHGYRYNQLLGRYICRERQRGTTIDIGTTTNQVGTYVEKNIQVQARIQVQLPTRYVSRERDRGTNLNIDRHCLLANNVLLCLDPTPKIHLYFDAMNGGSLTRVRTLCVCGIAEGSFTLAAIHCRNAMMGHIVSAKIENILSKQKRSGLQLSSE